MAATVQHVLSQARGWCMLVTTCRVEAGRVHQRLQRSQAQLTSKRSHTYTCCHWSDDCGTAAPGWLLGAAGGRQAC